MVIRLFPMDGPLRYIEFIILKGKTVIRTDRGFVEEGTWEKKDNVLELTVSNLSVAGEDYGDYMVFQVFTNPDKE